MKKIGMYNTYLDTKGGGEKVFLATAEYLSKKNDVTLIYHKKININELAVYFNLDLSRVKIKVISQKTQFYNLVDSLILIQSLRDFLKEKKFYIELKKEKYDIFVNNTYHSSLPNPAKKGVYMCMFPQKLKKEKTTNPIKIIYRFILNQLQRVFLYQFKASGIDTYDLITANSKYTQVYIKKLWNKNSKVLYPICDSMYLPNVKKEKIILNVGRFFEDGNIAHHKKQDFLLDTFRKSGLAKQGWQLHFVGSVAETGKTVKYIVDLLNTSKDLPVSFHFNAPFSEVKQLYNKAMIYWHATGFGTDEDKYPEKQEHFGISTVEAMSAKCIPVVIDRAGQKESVKNKQTGYLWSSQPQLIDVTNEVIELTSPAKTKVVNAAKNKSAEFNKNSFFSNLEDIFGLFI